MSKSKLELLTFDKTISVMATSNIKTIRRLKIQRAWLLTLVAGLVAVIVMLSGCGEAPIPGEAMAQEAIISESSTAEPSNAECRTVCVQACHENADHELICTNRCEFQTICNPE